MIRKSGITFSIVLIIFNLLTACSDSTPVLDKLSSDAVILAFGDSLTFGTGTSQDNSYPAILEKLTGHRVINAGVAGELSEQGLKRLPALLQKHNPALIVLCHAGNDFLRKKDKNLAKSNIINMIALAKENGAEIVLLGVPEPGLFLSSSKIYTEIAEQTNTLLLDDLLPEILSDTSLKSDPVHPNKDGYRKMAEGIMQALKKAGAL